MTTTFVGPQRERQLIRERIGSYADSVFQRDLESWLSHWARDAIWRIGTMEWCGRDALRAQWNRSWEVIDRLYFFNEIGAIEIGGQEASTRCYCHEIARYRNGRTENFFGMYEDKLIRTEDAWLFTQRSYRLLHKEESIAEKPIPTEIQVEKT